MGNCQFPFLSRQHDDHAECFKQWRNCRILALSHPHNDHVGALKGGRIADFVRCQIHITISFSSNSPTKHVLKQPNRYVGFPHNDFDFDEFSKETYGQTTKSLCGVEFR